MFKLPYISIKEVDLKTLPYPLWPEEAKQLACWILSSWKKKQILNDLFPLDRLIHEVEKQQRLQQEMEKEFDSMFPLTDTPYANNKRRKRGEPVKRKKRKKQ